MAHFVLSPRVSFERLVSIVADYINQKNRSTDPFERSEFESYLNSIADTIIFRRGLGYWENVLTKAKAVAA